jgi:hypothetical protein
VAVTEDLLTWLQPDQARTANAVDPAGAWTQAGYSRMFRGEPTGRGFVVAAERVGDAGSMGPQRAGWFRAAQDARTLLRLTAASAPSRLVLSALLFQGCA